MRACACFGPNRYDSNNTGTISLEEFKTNVAHAVPLHDLIADTEEYETAHRREPLKAKMLNIAQPR